MEPPGGTTTQGFNQQRSPFQPRVHVSVWRSFSLLSTETQAMTFSVLFCWFWSTAIPTQGSVQFSHSVVSDCLQPHRLQRTRLPCPSVSPEACSNSCLLTWWCHPTSSSFVAPFSSCPQSFPALRSFPVQQNTLLKSAFPYFVSLDFPVTLVSLHFVDEETQAPRC